MRALLSIFLFCFFFLEFSSSCFAGPIEEIEKKLENIRLEHLARVQKNPQKDLEKFTSDGCSGGLSDGWIWIAQVLPKFQKQFGAVPPWEHCCIEHDRAYWIGEVKEGFSKRKKADQLLKQCVTKQGQKMSKDLSKDFSIPREDIEEQFELVGEFMYKAVRLGGKPCTLFPWRWGYGWPLCSVF